jgi:hypothetical protein
MPKAGLPRARNHEDHEEHEENLFPKTLLHCFTVNRFSEP